MTATVNRLAGKKALVTGASTGIGRAVALAFARAGADVAVGCNRSRDEAERVAETIRSLGCRACVVVADVSDPLQLDEIAQQSRAELGELTTWANLAGADILTGTNAAAPDHEKLEKLIAVDLLGTMHGSWTAARYLADGGVIINTSWDLALRGMAGREAELFGAVKGGISGFSMSLARSLAPRIRVNVLAPGWIRTAFAQQDLPADAHHEISAKIPMARFGRPEEVADAALYLAGDDAAYVTGQILMINGGLAAGD